MCAVKITNVSKANCLVCRRFRQAVFKTITRRYYQTSENCGQLPASVGSFMVSFLTFIVHCGRFDFFFRNLIPRTAFENVLNDPLCWGDDQSWKKALLKFSRQGGHVEELKIISSNGKNVGKLVVVNLAMKIRLTNCCMIRSNSHRFISWGRLVMRRNSDLSERYAGTENI